MAEIVGAELALEPVPRLLAPRHGGDAGVEQQDVDGLPVRAAGLAEGAHGGEAGGVEAAEGQPRLRVTVPDRRHGALGLLAVAGGEGDRGARPREGEGGLVAEPAGRAGDDRVPSGLTRHVAGRPPGPGHRRASPLLG
jgi:hypothetical protein